MSNATATRNRAATIKRASSTLRALMRDLPGLTEKQRGALADAAAVLDGQGRTQTVEARRLKEDEARKEKIEAAARVEIARALAAWQSDILGKIALAVVEDGYEWKRQELRETLAGWTDWRKQHHEPTAQDFARIVDAARDEIAAGIAWRVAHRDAGLGVEVETLRVKFQSRLADPEVIALAKAWEIALVRDRLERANSKA